MKVPGIMSLVTLGVRDVPASTQFYLGLGFELSTASVEGQVSFFKTAGGLVGLFGQDDLAADAEVPARTVDGFRGVTLAMNLASRAAVDDALSAAEVAGARIVKAAQATEWGGYHGYFADPDDHLWELAYNPFWPLGADGLPQLP
jgi:predicted lactoylglutathione lyase